MVFVLDFLINNLSGISLSYPNPSTPSLSAHSPELSLLSNLHTLFSELGNRFKSHRFSVEPDWIIQSNWYHPGNSFPNFLTEIAHSPAQNQCCDVVRGAIFGMLLTCRDTSHKNYALSCTSSQFAHRSTRWIWMFSVRRPTDFFYFFFSVTSGISIRRHRRSSSCLFLLLPHLLTRFVFIRADRLVGWMDMWQPWCRPISLLNRAWCDWFLVAPTDLRTHPFAYSIPVSRPLFKFKSGSFRFLRNGLVFFSKNPSFTSTLLSLESFSYVLNEVLVTSYRSLDRKTERKGNQPRLFNYFPWQLHAN